MNIISNIVSKIFILTVFITGLSSNHVLAQVEKTPSDKIVPSIPADLNGTSVSATQVNLTWSAATDNVGVAGYKLYRDGVYVTSVTDTNYSNIGLTASTSYNYTVASFDAAGNNSAQSAIKSIKTLFSATPALPDVVVTNIRYYPGKIIATVKNQGTAATPAGVVIGVGYFVDGSYKTGTYVSGPLAAGASKYIVGNYTLPKGMHIIGALCDDVRRFRESDETNNNFTKRIIVPLRAIGVGDIFHRP